MAARTLEVDLAKVAQAPLEGLDIEARYRALLVDGNAAVLVADRKADRNQADGRLKPITNAVAWRATEKARLGQEGYREEYPNGITQEMVAGWGYDPRGIARGALREGYLALVARR